MDGQGFISKDMKQYLLPSNVRAGKVKGNSKMHKKDCPMRLIIASNNDPTEKMAEVDERELEEHVSNQPSYIHDAPDLLLKIKEVGSIAKDAILLCADVERLYPSIPYKEGIEACEKALKNRSNQDIPTSAVLDMITAVLQNNVFEYGGTQYIHKDGTAIESKLAKHYACTYLGEWECQLLEKAKVKP